MELIFITFYTTVGILSLGIEASVAGNFVVALASHLEKIALSWSCSLSSVNAHIGSYQRGGHVRGSHCLPGDFSCLRQLKWVIRMKLILSFPHRSCGKTVCWVRLLSQTAWETKCYMAQAARALQGCQVLYPWQELHCRFWWDAALPRSFFNLS